MPVLKGSLKEAIFLGRRKSIIVIAIPRSIIELIVTIRLNDRVIKLNKISREYFKATRLKVKLYLYRCFYILIHFFSLSLPWIFMKYLRVS